MNNKSGSLLGSSDIIGKPGSEVLKKSSQDYPVPESLCIRTSKLSEEEWWIISKEFQLAFTTLENFRNRLLFIQKNIPNFRVPKVNKLSEICPSIEEYCKSRKDLVNLRELIKWDILDSLRIPEIPAIFLDHEWNENTLDIYILIDSYLLALPVLYKMLISPHMRETYIKNISKTGINMEQFFSKIDVIVKEKIQLSNKIDKWFKEWTL